LLLVHAGVVDRRWQDVTTPQGATLGDTVLTAFDMYPEQHWVWWGVLMLIAYAALFLGTTGVSPLIQTAPNCYSPFFPVACLSGAAS
jgi:hypothetical protein